MLTIGSDITGFYFLPPPETEFKPSESLAKYLESGPPPIYIGFGSVVVKHPAKMTGEFRT